MPDIYLIKDLARVSGYSVYTLKYYLKVGLINEAGRFPSTNFRYFDNNALAQLADIRRLRKENKSIKAIKRILNLGYKDK